MDFQNSKMFSARKPFFVIQHVSHRKKKKYIYIYLPTLPNVFSAVTRTTQFFFFLPYAQPGEDGAKGEVDGCALNGHGNHIVDHGKSWNSVFEFLWEPCKMLQFMF